MKNKFITLGVFLITLLFTGCPSSSLTGDPKSIADYALKCYQKNELSLLIEYADPDYVETLKGICAKEAELHTVVKEKAQTDVDTKKHYEMRIKRLASVKKANYVRVAQKEVDDDPNFLTIEYKALEEGKEYFLNIQVKQNNGEWKIKSVKAW